MPIIQPYRQHGGAVVNIATCASQIAIPASVISIGVFDGVHLGHRRVLAALREIGERSRLPTAVVTFDPHPRLVFQPQKPLHMIASVQRRTALMAETGMVDTCVVLPFDQRQRDQSADEFVEEILVGTLGMKALVVGENFSCGRGRAGTVEYLARLGERLGFSVYPIRLRRMIAGNSGLPCSSTELRRLIHLGEVEQAAALLGRPHEIDCVAMSISPNEERFDVLFPAGRCIPPVGEYVGFVNADPAQSLSWCPAQFRVFFQSGRHVCTVRPLANPHVIARPGHLLVLRFVEKPSGRTSSETLIEIAA
jgi:riboflavin kinase/FMN adenylyltransferase